MSEKAVFTVKLDDADEDLLMTTNLTEAVIVHGIVTAVLVQKKISGNVRLFSNLRNAPILDETYENGEKVARSVYV